jgi:hypothetical protein
MSQAVTSKELKIITERDIQIRISEINKKYFESKKKVEEIKNIK